MATSTLRSSVESGSRSSGTDEAIPNFPTPPVILRKLLQLANVYPGATGFQGGQFLSVPPPAKIASGGHMSTDRRRQELIQRARQGERDAFDVLAREHEGPLRSLISIQLGEGLRSRVEVDDLLQETLLRAFRSIEQFRGNDDDALRGWLAGIAHHAVADRARRLTAGKADYRREVSLDAKAFGASCDSSPTPVEALSRQTSPSRMLRREERLERLLQAIQTLSPNHRQVILLTLIERLPAREVALRMDRSEKAVSMLLFRAMRALRDVFGDTSSLTLPRELHPGAGKGDEDCR